MTRGPAWMGEAVRAEDLGKRFRDRAAVERLSFAVEAGRVLGLLGPNGAGKTTTVRMLTTVIRPSAGWARVAGADIVRSPVAVRRSVAVVSQGSDLNPFLTVEENCFVYLRIRGESGAEARRRTAVALEEFGLSRQARLRPSHLSGGQRRRVQLARVLASRTPIVFLDEPSTGLDPVARAHLWSSIQEKVREGLTVILTTQVLEEAEQLCTDVLFLFDGRKVLHGSVQEVKRLVGSDRLILRCRAPAPESATARLQQVPGVTGVTWNDGAIVVASEDPQRVASSVLRCLWESECEVQALSMVPVTLMDVYKKVAGGA